MFVERANNEVNPRRHIEVILRNQWGFIIPEETGVFYQLQTDGIACHHVSIEGIFIPLEELYDIVTVPKKNGKDWERIDYLKQIQDLHYKYRNEDEINKVWDIIKKKLGFDWEDEDGIFCEEGWKIITITKVPLEDISWADDFRQLLGETVILAYPNCD